MKRFAILGLILMSAGSGFAEPVPFPSGQPARPVAEGQPTTALALEDQWEQMRDLSPYAGDVVVLLYGDRSGMAGSRALGEKLHVEFHPGAAGLQPNQARQVAVAPLPGMPAGQRSPDVHVVPVACIGKVPNLVKGMIRSQVKKGSPDVPVWLDYDDTMKKRYGIKDGSANLVVFDALGRARFRVLGEPNAEQYAKLVQVVQSLRAEAAAVPPAAPVTIQPPR